MSIVVRRGGLLTTIQDLGRVGYRQYGVPLGGVMDQLSARIANLLVGNSEGDAVCEMTLQGPELVFEKDALVAVCGCDLSLALDGQPGRLWRPLAVRRGLTLTVGNARSGCRAYLAVAGGFDVPRVMHSRSTYLPAALGGLGGSALQAGDQLSTGQPSAIAIQWLRHALDQQPNDLFVRSDWFVAGDLRPSGSTVRAIRGGQFDWFTPESRQRFFTSSFQVTTESDRTGYRLTGPELGLQQPRELVSEAAAMGTVQVPPGGHPIVLMADHPTTGGYPKIGQVATVDLPVLAQARPGDTIEFREVSVAEAQRLYRQREADLRKLRCAISLRDTLRWHPST